MRKPPGEAAEHEQADQDANADVKRQQRGLLVVLELHEEVAEDELEDDQRRNGPVEELVDAAPALRDPADAHAHRKLRQTENDDA
jgi:hypothetical protein